MGKNHGGNGTVMDDRALEYLEKFSTDKASWKFNKLLQTHLLNLVYQRKRLDKGAFKNVLTYLEGLTGAARSKTLLAAKAIIDEADTAAAEEGDGAETAAGEAGETRLRRYAEPAADEETTGKKAKKKKDEGKEEEDAAAAADKMVTEDGEEKSKAGGEEGEGAAGGAKADQLSDKDKATRLKRAQKILALLS